MGVNAPTGPIDAARRALQRERRQLRDEREALKAFGKRVAEIDTASPAAGHQRFPLAGAGSTGLQSVREAYADTVMDVPHYELAYDESLPEHMAGELGEELAAAVTGEGGSTPH